MAGYDGGIRTVADACAQRIVCDPAVGAGRWLSPKKRWSHEGFRVVILLQLIQVHRVMPRSCAAVRRDLIVRTHRQALLARGSAPPQPILGRR